MFVVKITQWCSITAFLDECYHQFKPQKIPITIKNSYPLWYTHRLKENWTINFSSVLYASTEILSKRKFTPSCKRENDNLIPTTSFITFDL